MSYTRNYIHIVFSTKYRKGCLVRDREQSLFAYIIKIIENKQSACIAINGMPDHLHILLDLHPSVALADMVKSIKQSSSRWITNSNHFFLFEGWSPEYYACSVSPAHVDAIKNYIETQKEHHTGMVFQKEMENYVHKMGMTLYKDV